MKLPLASLPGAQASVSGAAPGRWSKTFASGITVTLLAFLSLPPAAAPGQAVPTTPTKFDTKPVGAATSSTGAAIAPPKAPASTLRQVTYLTLSPLRTWTSTDGKSLNGKLIAWEETVTTGPTPQALPDQPLTTRPTVLKNNKARLLIGTKAYEVPLDRLGPEEQKFIRDLQTRLAAKP